VTGIAARVATGFILCIYCMHVYTIYIYLLYLLRLSSSHHAFPFAAAPAPAGVTVIAGRVATGSKLCIYYMHVYTIYISIISIETKFLPLFFLQPRPPLLV